MTIASSKLTSQGQVSVPLQVRRRLGLSPGSVLEWVDENGQVKVRRAATHTSEDIHRALFAKQPRNKTLADLKQGIRSHMRTRHARG